MKIIVDADACPVKETIVKIAGQHQLPVIMVSSTEHLISTPGTEIIMVDNHSQSADIYIANHCQPGDIVVTQDYGLAAIVMARGANAINPFGNIYTNDNIDRLLMQRYLNQKARKAREKTSRTSPRTREDNHHFEFGLNKLINSVEK